MPSQMIVFVFMAVMSSGVSEKLFHSRDHSDVEMSSSHLAELVTDTDTAQVRKRNTCTLFFCDHLETSTHYWCSVNLPSSKQKPISWLVPTKMYRCLVWQRHGGSVICLIRDRFPLCLDGVCKISEVSVGFLQILRSPPLVQRPCIWLPSLNYL